MDRITILKAIEKVRRVFPFDGYIDDISSHVEIARIVSGNLPRGARILDVGSGPCDKTAVLSLLGFHCTACDDLNDFWHKEGANRKLIVDFTKLVGIQFDMLKEQKLPYPDDTFDCVIFSDVIEHLHDSPRVILNDALAKLKPGGLLLITMPNSVNLRKRISVLTGHSNYQSLELFFWSPLPYRGHVREYTLQETKRLLRLMGLEIVEAYTFHGMLARRVHSSLAKSLYILLTTLIPGCRDSIAVVGRKPQGWRPILADSRNYLRYFLKNTTWRPIT